MGGKSLAASMADVIKETMLTEVTNMQATTERLCTLTADAVLGKLASEVDRIYSCLGKLAAQVACFAPPSPGTSGQPPVVPSRPLAAPPVGPLAADPPAPPPHGTSGRPPAAPVVPERPLAAPLVGPLAADPPLAETALPPSGLAKEVDVPWQSLTSPTGGGVAHRCHYRNIYVANSVSCFATLFSNVSKSA